MRSHGISRAAVAGMHDDLVIAIALAPVAAAITGQEGGGVIGCTQG
jgi:hypothetical protein